MPTAPLKPCAVCSKIRRRLSAELERAEKEAATASLDRYGARLEGYEEGIYEAVNIVAEELASDGEDEVKTMHEGRAQASIAPLKPPKFRDPAHVISWMLASTKTLAALREVARQTGTTDKVESEIRLRQKQVNETALEALKAMAPCP